MKHLCKIIILLNFFFIFNVKASEVCNYNFILGNNKCTFYYYEDGYFDFKCLDEAKNEIEPDENYSYKFSINNKKYSLSVNYASVIDGAFQYNSEKCSKLNYKIERVKVADGESMTLFPGVSSDNNDGVVNNGNVILVQTSSDSQDSSNSSNSYNRYDDIEMCGENSNDYIYACACMPAAVADITSFIYGFLKIGGPVLLIILGAIDLGKAIVATDESGIQKAKKKLINKFVAAACIFLAFSVIQMIVNIVGGGDYVQQVEGNCLYYLLNGFKP